MDPVTCNLEQALTNPEVLAGLLPLGVVLAVLSTGAIFITVRVLFTIFVGTARRLKPAPKKKAEKRSWFGRKKDATPPGESVKELLSKNRTLEEQKRILQEQYEKSKVRIADLEAQVRSLEDQLVHQREEIAMENEKIMELRRHAERLETQLEEAVVEVERIYRNMPPGAMGLVGNTQPQAAPQPDATPEQMQKLKEILSTYTDRLDKTGSDK